ncbi:MAG: DUF262 domain-containing protein [Prevotella sp.]|nr:DUF262 domain-containing protein [Prevotella sp.]
MDKNLPLKELSINDVFNGNDNVKFEIPIYQRNYAWEKDEITALVRDVWDAYEKDKDTYFIGTLVTYDKGDNTFEVIDGQQRLTTLFLILKALKQDVRNKLTYRARRRSNETIEKIPIFKHDSRDNAIRSGYENVVLAIGEIVTEEKMHLFTNYLLNNVHIIHYGVPKDVDLNHYFEVMNSRGEQLEKHEIIKAKLMDKLDDENDKIKFAAIWEACSEMNTYIQSKEGMKDYFEDNMKAFKYYGDSFDDLPNADKSESRTSTLKDLINAPVPTGKDSDNNIDSKNSKFQPIIDFPNFLLIVLKITRMGDSGFIPNDFILDDKELINEFDKAIEIESDSAFAKRFCFNLLLVRYLLDNYVVHHTNEEDAYDHNPWQLRYWNKEEKARTKNLSNDQTQQDKMVQLLSMFEVSFTARQRKNYLFYVLFHLFRNRDLESYCNFLEDLAKKYFYDIYMDSEYLNEINTPKPGAFDLTIIKEGCVDLYISNPDISLDKFNRIYGDGSKKTKGIPLFVFNYMDYCLWYKYATTLAGEELKKDDSKRRAFFDELGCSDFGLDVFKQFYFSRTRRSLEHYYPQALVKKYLDAINEDQINCFGNFAMIGSDANSSGSDWTPKAKLDHYLDPSMKIRRVGVASLKFRVMMQICQDNYEYKIRQVGLEWMFNDIKKHQELMLKILIDQLV